MDAILLFRVLNFEVCERLVKYNDIILGSAGKDLKLFFIDSRISNKLYSKL